MISNHPRFLEAINQRKKVSLRFYSKADNGVLDRVCAPMDYGPWGENQDGLDRYWFWDYTGNPGTRILGLLPQQIVALQVLDEVFEYACRAGTTSAYSFGSDPSGLAAYAWFKKDSQNTTHPVGQKRPNPWGLYDMHGNVAEWCHDVYDAGCYQRREGENPTGPASGEERVLRGGSWAAAEEACRSSARSSDAPGFADVCFGYDAYGFRCVRRSPGRAQ